MSFQIKIYVSMKCCVDFWIRGSMRRCLWAQGRWGWAQSQGSPRQQCPLKLTLLLPLLSSLTQHANTGQHWSRSLNELHQLLQHKIFSTIHVQHTVPLSWVYVFSTSLWDSEIWNCPQLAFCLLLLKWKWSNKMFQIEAGSWAVPRSKCICNTLSVFDALPLNFCAKPCGIYRCSKAFTCYFVLMYLSVLY